MRSYPVFLVILSVLLMGCGETPKQKQKEAPIPDVIFETVITNGQVFTKGKLITQNIGITNEGTIYLSNSTLRGEDTLDATGKIVSAGFIDILADGPKDFTNAYKVFEKFKLSDGVTTTLQLHGGRENPSAYHDFFDKKPHFTNHGVGIYVMGVRAASTIAQREKLIEKALTEGGLSVSHSLEYQPTPYEELKRYALLAKKYGRPMFLHLRYSSKEQELDGVKEALQIAEETGVQLHIGHLHSTGGTYAMHEALALIEAARAKGLSVTCCVYPYSFWATYLHSKRFDEGWQQRYGLTFNDLQLVGTSQRLTETSFNFYRKRPGYLVAVPEGTMPFASTIDLALKKDFCLIGSDGGIVSETDANSHPRGAGCFATAIRHGFDIGLTLEKILPKFTSQPAKILGLQNRGDIQTGFVADLCVFDPATVRGRATVENPNQTSAGIIAVFVNGKLAYRPDTFLGEYGKAIRAKKANPEPAQ